MQEHTKDHKNWVDLIQRLLDMTLPEDQTQKLNEHLEECESCFGVYIQCMEEEFVETSQENSLYLTERPSWGPLAWSPEEIEERADEISFQALLQEQEKQPIVVKHALYQDVSIQLMLLRVATKLRQERRKVRFFPSTAEDFLPETNGESSHLIIPYAPSHPYFLEQLQQLTRQNQVIIASGRHEEWDGTFLPFNHISYVFEISEQTRFVSKLQEEVSQQVEALAQQEEVYRAYCWVCLLDAFAVPMPVSLLARLMHREGKTIRALLNAARGFILPLRAEAERELLTTAGEAIARAVVEQEFADVEVRRAAYRQLVEAAAFEECTTILRIFHCMARRGERLFVRALCKEQSVWASIQHVFTSARATVKELLYWGKTLGEVGLFQEAQEVFDKGLQRPLHPTLERVPLLHAYAQTLAAQRKYEPAAKLFQEANTLDKHNVYVWQAWADMERAEGKQRFRPAEAKYSEVLKLDPTNHYAQVSLGHLFMNMALEPQVTRGDAAMIRTFFESAATHFNTVLQSDPRNIYARQSLGVLEHRNSNYQQAEIHFRKALLLDAHNVPTLNAWGAMARDRGDWATAERCLQDALAIDPENIETLHAMGHLRVDQGRYREARQYFDKVLELDERNLYAYVSLMVMENQRRHFAQAEEWYFKALDVSASRENVYLLGVRVEALIQQRRDDEAEAEIEEMRQHILRGQLTAPLLNMRAMLWAKQDKFPVAEADVQKAVDLEPRNVWTYNTWADIEMLWAQYAQRHNNPEEASSHLKNARQHVEKSRGIDPANTYTQAKWSVSTCGLPVDFDRPAVYFCRQHGLLSENEDITQSRLTEVLQLIKECFHSVHAIRLEPAQDPETGEEWLSIVVTVSGEVEALFEQDNQYCQREIQAIPWPLRNTFNVSLNIVTE